MLRSAARISSIAGLGLAGCDDTDVMANAISRAAMDMPNPHTEFFGIDPYFRISKARLLRELDTDHIDAVYHKFIHGKGIAGLKKRAEPTNVQRQRAAQ